MDRLYNSAQALGHALKTATPSVRKLMHAHVDGSCLVNCHAREDNAAPGLQAVLLGHGVWLGNLCRLTLVNVQLSALLPDELVAACPNLTHLALQHCQLVPTVYKGKLVVQPSMSHYPTLTSLTIIDCPITYAPDASNEAIARQLAPYQLSGLSHLIIETKRDDCGLVMDVLWATVMEMAGVRCKTHKGSGCVSMVMARQAVAVPSAWWGD